MKITRKVDSQGKTKSTEFLTNDHERRRWSRNYVTVPLPIFEASTPHNQGMIENISEHGLGIVGMNSSVGETKSLVIEAPEFDFIAPVTFDAMCCWTGTDQNGTPLGGYEITAIPETSRTILSRLIRSLTFGT